MRLKVSMGNEMRFGAHQIVDPFGGTVEGIIVHGCHTERRIVDGNRLQSRPCFETHFVS